MWISLSSFNFMQIKIYLFKFFSLMTNIFEKVSKKRIGILAWVFSFACIIGLRMFIEFFLVSSRVFTFEDVIIEYLHNFLFFGITFVLLWLFISFILKINPREIAYLISLAFWIIILPPIADMIKTGGSVYWSFYALTNFKDVFTQFITFFGNLPQGIMYFGTRIGFSLAIIFCGILILLKTKSLFKAIFGAICSYVIIFCMGLFPSIFTYVFHLFSGSKKLNDIMDFNTVQLFGGSGRIFGVEFEKVSYVFAYNLNIVYYCFLFLLLALLFFWLDRAKFKAFLENLRIPQIIYHFGLFVIGMGIGILVYPDNFNFNIFAVFAVLSLFGAIFLAWEASVICNDIYDFKIDKISNSWRPLPRKIFSVEEYKVFGVIMFLLSLLGGLVIGMKFMVLLFIYQILAWFYSSEPFRLKKIPLLASFLSSFASIIVLFMGFVLLSGDNNLAGLSWRIVILLLATFTCSLPIKDFKDIEGDRKDGIWTIPVIFGEKIGRLIVASGVFLSFMLSVFLLNEAGLFLWALVFGSVAFLAIVRTEIKNTKVFWWILGLIFIYLLLLIKIIFLK